MPWNVPAQWQSMVSLESRTRLRLCQQQNKWHTFVQYKLLSLLCKSNPLTVTSMVIPCIVVADNGSVVSSSSASCASMRRADLALAPGVRFLAPKYVK